ncbi:MULTISPECIES: bifunctional diguanylate cyclase/phosphodiesterase [unclassified Clostridium]|uniref:putative bifunctional diguanylate cyclase/phosphodiesterase n=1 Tax=unclassified Clostridium TaxID=2614128 RepID=UPI000297FBA2|nr:MULTISPECIES: bifunctional diguanylate cyclase/phosphodiesterase [unclassified Clostridium]EKQ55402.1 MAG: diguanylate cyclase (GGDEF) domain-containing protein [Clostridium sp. Maddingley MBC34-26]
MIREEFKLNHEEIINSTDVNGIAVIWNPSECTLIIDDKIKNFIEEFDVKNYELEQFICFVKEEDKPSIISFFTQDLNKSYESREQLQQRYNIKGKDGKFIECILVGNVAKNNLKYYFIGTNYCLGDISEKYSNINLWMEKWKQSILNKTFNSITQCDRITGLPNKYFFKKVVSNLLKDIVNNNARAAMIVIDIDNFKYVNDSYGHDFGDLLLKEISDNILSSINDNVIVSRYSGNTFILFMSDIIDIQEVVALCNRIIKSFENPNIVEEKKIYLTASIGISLSPDHGIDYNTLLKNADAAMYEAKKNGKNECDFFDDNLSAELNRVYSLQKGLRTALQNNEFYVMFQPKVSLDDSLVNGFEALARWESNEFGPVSPAEFIPIAESSKMIIPIGSFVLEEVFKKIKCLLMEGNDNFKIAVNLSEIQFREDVVLSDFKRLIKKYRINPKYIEVEITESVLMKSFEKNVRILQEIKRLGVSIALDDFGTGYSSLNYLTKLPIDVLKIDRSFVIDLMNNPKNKCIVENIINLSHQLGIEVVAEGVEEKSQVEYLRTILCDVVQGYYFSQPKMFDAIKNIIGKEIS